MVSNLETKLEQYNFAESKIKIYESLSESLLKEVKANEIEVGRIQTELNVLQEVNDLFLSFSEAYKKLVVDKIEALVTEGIQTILKDKSISFRFKIESKRNNLDISFKIFDSITKKETDLLYGEAGGIKNIVAILLRIILIILSTKTPAPIILDEVGTGVSEEHREDFGKFLKVLSEKLNVQIVFITHLSEVAAQSDTIISVSKTKGISNVIC